MSQARMRIVYVGGWGAEPELDHDASLRAHLAALAAAWPDAHPIVLGPGPSLLRERHGVDAAPDLSHYLFAPDPAGEPPRCSLVLRRLSILIAAAEGRGAAPDVPGVAATLALLGSARAVIDVGAGSFAAGERDALWSQAAAVYVAAARGVPVLVSASGIGPIENDLDAIVLGRLLRSAALVNLSGRAGSAAYARHLGAREVAEGLDEAAQLARALDVLPKSLRRRGTHGSEAVSIEPLGDLEDARALWERLEGATANPFATWMFAELWWRHLGEQRPLHLLGVRAHGDVVALLPVYDTGDELRLIGYVDADLLGPVGAPEHHALALAALGEFVSGMGRRLIADELPDGSAGLLGGEVVRRTSSPVLDLPAAGFEAVLAARSTKLRSAVRTRERLLARAHRVQLRTADEQTLPRDLETLFALHHARWNGSTTVFSGPRVAFHRELAQRAMTRGWLRLRLLELDGRPVAANYAFRVGDAEWYYQAGRDPAFARASVGHVLLAACIRSACEEGAREYRLLRGDEPYKLSWANRDAPLETVLVGGRR